MPTEEIDEIETQVREYLSLFDKDVYKETLEHLETLIQLWKRVRSRIHKDQRGRLHFVETFNAIKAATLREEFLAKYTTAGSADIFDSIDNMFSRLTHTEKSLDWSYLFDDIMTRTEVFVNITATKRKLAELSKLMVGMPSQENRFYLACFMFLLAMEGMYDEVVRCVYAHEQVIDGKPIVAKELWSERIDTIKRKIGIAPRAIFDIWDKGHRVRNAIAHASFVYSDDDKKMRFVDVNPYDSTDVYTISMAIDEIGELVERIGVIETAFRHLIILLNVYTFLLTPPEQFELTP
jgi:hypothetical protein